jgi:hypothetical protein
LVWAGLALLALALAAGCGAGASSASTPSGRSAGPARPANRGLPSSVSECLRLRDPGAGVAAYASDGTRLPFDVFAGHEPGTEPRCRPDELRILRLATLSAGGRPTYLRRGGCQTPCVVRQATVQVPANAFATPISVLPVAARHGDGAPVRGCEVSVRAAPQLAGRELARMFYKRPAETSPGAAPTPDTGARWSNYGDPGWIYSGPAAAGADYGYLLWNLPRTAGGVLHGGGIVEAVLARGQPIDLCAGARLVLPAFDAAGRLDGHVAFAYAELRPAVFGWVMVAYTYRGHHQATTT